jgi:hypothetical protein
MPHILKNEQQSTINKTQTLPRVLRGSISFDRIPFSLVSLKELQPLRVTQTPTEPKRVGPLRRHWINIVHQKHAIYNSVSLSIVSNEIEIWLKITIQKLVPSHAKYSLENCLRAVNSLLKCSSLSVVLPRITP